MFGKAIVTRFARWLVGEREYKPLPRCGSCGKVFAGRGYWRLGHFYCSISCASPLPFGLDDFISRGKGPLMALALVVAAQAVPPPPRMPVVPAPPRGRPPIVVPMRPPVSHPATPALRKTR